MQIEKLFTRVTPRRMCTRRYFTSPVTRMSYDFLWILLENLSSATYIYIIVSTSIICEPIASSARLYFRVAINWIGILAIST